MLNLFHLPYAPPDGFPRDFKMPCDSDGTENVQNIQFAKQMGFHGIFFAMVYDRELHPGRTVGNILCGIVRIMMQTVGCGLYL